MPKTLNEHVFASTISFNFLTRHWRRKQVAREDQRCFKRRPARIRLFLGVFSYPLRFIGSHFSLIFQLHRLEITGERT